MSVTGDRIKTLAAIYGQTQTELAKKLDITTKRLNNYMTGRSEPGYELLISIADIFSTSVDYLLGLTGNAAPLATSVTRVSMGASYNTQIPPEDGKSFLVELYESRFGATENKTYGQVKTNTLQYPSAAYALLIKDDCMYPDFIVNDVVFVEPVNQSPDTDGIYVVKLSENDETGISVRLCTFSNGVVIVSALNNAYKPEIIDISNISGRPIGIYREHEFNSH